MMKKILTILLCSHLALYLFSEEKSALSAENQFGKASHSFKGSSLPYRIFIPQGMDPGKKYPLVLALHGMGERGNDNNMQLSANKMATCWAEPAVQEKNPCYVIAPQCPVTSGWADSPVKDVLLNLVDSALTKFNIDPARVYITGLSMGGNGTWNCISLRPDLFAAAVPIAGWGNTAKAPLIQHIPIWAFHGQADNVVSVDNSRFMVEAISKQGIEAIYTNCFYLDSRPLPAEKLNNELQAHSSLFYSELLGYQHNVWDYAYNQKTLINWVFTKRKLIPDAIRLSSFLNDTTVHTLTSIDWTATNSNDSVEIWFKSERQEKWKLLSKDLAAKKPFHWNTDAENQCIFGQLRLCLTDSNSRVFSQAESAWITIDQPGNGTPYVKLKTPDFYKASNIISKRIDVNYLANDVEPDSLRVRFDYSADGGKSYYTIDSVKVMADNTLKTKTILFSKQLNTNKGVLKLIVSDNQGGTAADSTISFSNQLGVNATDVSDHELGKNIASPHAFPNPANQMVEISFQLPKNGEVSVSIFNTSGQKVIQQSEGLKNKGLQTIHLKTAQLPAGLYSYQVNARLKQNSDSFHESGKFIVQH